MRKEKIMKQHTKDAAKDLIWTIATCGFYFAVIFLRVLFTTKSGQEIVEEKIDKKLKAKLIEKKADKKEEK